jgi:UDP-2,3-diacylglucosamine pyrophosphatase LpxH
MRPLVVLSDVHLGHEGRDSVASDLARLVASHPGHEIVLNGDIFNLSCDPRGRNPAESAAAMWGRHPRLRGALRDHVASGSPITLLAGNHDAGVQTPGVRAALLGRLELTDDAELRVEPWFVRRNGVHIEHGHMYDPDNAQAHPLAPPAFRSEPLGVALKRRFLGAHDKFVSAHQHEATPVENIKFAFQECGLRAPLILLRFCAVSAAICAETSVRSRLGAEERRGEAELAGCAASTGIPEATLRELLEARPEPTHKSFRRTFLRLYYDRMMATFAVPAGLLAAFAGAGAGGVVLSVASLAYVMESVRRGANRNPGGMPGHLRRGAAIVRRLTGASLVLFGHTHRDDEAEGYFNSGSFGYPERTERSFLRVDERGRAERRTLPGAV